MAFEFESELTASRDDIAAVLTSVVDGIAVGSIQLHGEDEGFSVEVPEEVTLEIECETEDDGLSLELELEWPFSEHEVEQSAADTTSELSEDDEPTSPIRAVDGSKTLAQFEVFRDQRGEWRWRLRHRNGKIIATSGEGYTRKHNAQNGIRSVMENAPNAEITEDIEK